jgi:hypothetical protein
VVQGVRAPVAPRASSSTANALRRGRPAYETGPSSTPPGGAQRVGCNCEERRSIPRWHRGESAGEAGEGGSPRAQARRAGSGARAGRERVKDLIGVPGPGCGLVCSQPSREGGCRWLAAALALDPVMDRGTGDAEHSLGLTRALICTSFEDLTCMKGTKGVAWSPQPAQGAREGTQPTQGAPSRSTPSARRSSLERRAGLLMCLPRTARPTRASQIRARCSASGRDATAGCDARAAALPRPSDGGRCAPPALGWPRPHPLGGVRRERPGACRRRGKGARRRAR